MKKKVSKKKASKKQSKGTALIVTALAIVLVFGGFQISRANFPFLDKLAVYAGETLGSRLAEQIDIGAGESIEFPSFGALSGPEVGPFISLSGFQTHGTRLMVADKASSTVCAIRPPVGSSTLSVLLYSADATSTAYDVQLFETSITGGATGTMISQVNVPAGTIPRISLFGPQFSTSTLTNHSSGVILSNSGSTTNAAEISFATDDDVLTVKTIGKSTDDNWRISNLSCDAEFKQF